VISELTQAFTHLDNVLTEEFSSTFTTSVKNIVLKRLESMTEKDLKDIDKDEIGSLIASLKEFLLLSCSRLEAAEFVEHTSLLMALRFLKSENLEKRLKGLSEIRTMVERVIERSRFERWRQKTNKSLSHWNSMPENKDKPYPSDAIKLAELKQWLISNKVLQIILGPNAHVEIVKRSGPILKLLCRYGENLFDESIIELIWRCQLDKHEEMVRTIYNLIQEVLPILSLPIIDSFFLKMKSMPPAQIDEKYVVFVREFTKQALKKRLEFSFEEYSLRADQSTQDVQLQFYINVR